MSELYRGNGHSFNGGHCGQKQTSFGEWTTEIEKLNQDKKSPYVMQSNMDFTLNGSLSANCHGWQANDGPIGNHVSNLIIDRGNGLEEADEETSKAIIGGFGLAGEIVKFDYKTIDNYGVESFVGEASAHLTVGRDYDCDMLNIHLDGNWERSIVNEHYYTKETLVSELKDEVSPWAGFLVRYFPRMRWWAQKNMNLHNISSRNELLYTSTKHFAWPNQELFEVFVPTENASDFVKRARSTIQKIPTYNTTVRDIQDAAEYTFLPYAKGKTRGFVVLCKKHPSNATYIQRMYDIAIEMGGSYYLPYNMFATRKQFQLAYPGFEKLIEYQINETEWSKKYLGDLK